jgi:hypothetical protein
MKSLNSLLLSSWDRKWRTKMKKTMAALGCLALWLVVSPAQAIDKNSDPYSPLRRYDGKWEVTPSGAEKKTDHIENHCAKTGLFFVCEQVVNGKTGGLVVFLPGGKTSNGAQEYRTEVLAPNASTPGEWSKLTIDGDTWLYSWTSSEGGGKIYWRNTNTFSGRDKIHFEIQQSEDGVNWKTKLSGDEHRGA